MEQDRSKRDQHTVGLAPPWRRQARTMCAHGDGANAGGFDCLQEGYLAWGLLGGDLNALVKKKLKKHIKTFEKQIKTFEKQIQSHEKHIKTCEKQIKAN